MDFSHIKVISIGAAVQDVFLGGKVLAAKRDVRTNNYVEQFPLGAKLELDNIHFDTGGGATNAAVTFARQGLHASFGGKIGRDPAGAEIIRVLKREGIDTKHVAVDEKNGTGYSALLVAPNGERTILNYRGASHNIKPSDFHKHIIEADWMYISSLAGNMELLKRLLVHAHKHNIKVALNPGHGELTHVGKLRSYLKGVDVLMANWQEMQILFGGEKPTQTIVNGMPFVSYFVMTDGPNGSYATDGDVIYHAGQYKNVKVIDRTGAGDAFCSGFVATLAKGGTIEQALTFGSANSTSVVQEIGAKPGILHGTKGVGRMKIRKLSIK